MPWKKILLEDDPVGATAEEVWTYSNRSLTDKEGFGMERLGNCTIGQLYDVHTPVTILDISGKGFVSVFRFRNSLSPKPKITIDGTVQSAPFDGTTVPYDLRVIYGVYATQEGFWLPLVPFKSSFKYEELDNGYVNVGYVYALYGSRIVERKVIDDEKLNIRFEYVRYDTGARVFRAVSNLKPIEAPRVETVEEKLDKISAKLDKLLEMLSIRRL